MTTVLDNHSQFAIPSRIQLKNSPFPPTLQARCSSCFQSVSKRLHASSCLRMLYSNVKNKSLPKISTVHTDRSYLPGTDVVYHFVNRIRRPF